MDDLELAASQWIPLGQILERIPLERDEALRACLLRGLDRVRPAVLYFDEVPQPLYQLGDAYHDGCVRAALTPRQDRHPNDTDDPSALTVDFHVLALLDWARGTDLEVDTAPWKAWKRDVLPELRRCGLLHGQPPSDAPPAPGPITQIAPAGVVKEKLLATMTGYSVDALETMRRRGVVTEGVHWFRTPKGGISWEVEAFGEWQRNE